MGSASKAFSVAEKYAPRVTDKAMEATLFGMQHSDRPPQRDREGGLHHPARTGYMHRWGEYEGHTQRRSFYTDATTHPWITTAVLGAAGAAVAGALLAAGTRHERNSHRVMRKARERVRGMWK